MIKSGIEAGNKNGISYLYKDGKKLKYKPWLGDLFSFLYDPIMRKSIFPKKFEASIESHLQFLKGEFRDVHNSTIMELATGSGNLSEVMPCDNKYIGIDISEGLLKIASRRFTANGFKKPEFYICSAEELPFQDNFFDMCICNLSLNFFDDLNSVVKQIKRILKNKCMFICSVPVPEKNKKQSVIRGKLYTESELKSIFIDNGFNYSSYDFANGAILYFKAILRD